MKIASPAFPRITPVTETLRSPVPRFFARIALVEPVTALAVIVILDPLAVVLWAYIPWKFVPDPITFPVALIEISPPSVFPA